MDGMVQRLAHRYGPQRVASRVPLRVREVVVGACIAAFAALVAVKYACCIATMIP